MRTHMMVITMVLVGMLMTACASKENKVTSFQEDQDQFSYVEGTANRFR